MVCFTCNRCGESLKKKDVEKHCYGRCRGPPFLTCVDCLKDFREDYSKHFLCISEDDRYSANGLKSKTMTKQQRWVMLVHQTCEKYLAENKVDHSMRSLLEYLGEYPSIPDKEKPFRNFVTNLRKYNANSIQSVWDILQQAKVEEAKKISDSKVVNGTQKIKNGNSDDSTKANFEKKPDDTIDEKSNENQQDDQNDQQEVTGDNINKKKKKKNSSLNNSSYDDMLKEPESNSITEEEPVKVEKLSKKERKEKKKREKYEAQLIEIMKENNEDTNKGSVENEFEEPIKKKIKKNTDSSDTIDVHNFEPSKKSKKRKLKDEDIFEKSEDKDAFFSKKVKSCEPDKKEENEETNIDANGKSSNKFSWESTILQVLESKEGKEMSLKRLSKKVINEYLSSLGDNVFMDEAKLGAKLQKKLHKMHNVMVHKDKVKVKTSRS